MTSKYDTMYYCSICGEWIPKWKAVRDSIGRPRCPRCMHTLRLKPKKRAAEVSALG